MLMIAKMHHFSLIELHIYLLYLVYREAKRLAIGTFED